MKFYDLTELKKQILKDMEDYHTQMVIVKVKEVSLIAGQIGRDEEYKLFVTKNIFTRELNFFTTNGIHMSWITELSNMPSDVAYIELLSLTDIAKLSITI